MRHDLSNKEKNILVQVRFSTSFLQVFVLQVLLLRVCVLLVHALLVRVFPSPVQSAKNIICLTVDIRTVAVWRVGGIAKKTDKFTAFI